MNCARMMSFPKESASGQKCCLREGILTTEQAIPGEIRLENAAERWGRNGPGENGDSQYTLKYRKINAYEYYNKRIFENVIW